MWDEEDGFYYDVLRLPDGRATRLKVRSMVGLLPLCATTVIEPWQRERVPRLVAHFTERVRRMPELMRGNPPYGPATPGIRRPRHVCGGQSRAAAPHPYADARRERVPKPLRHPVAVALPQGPSVRLQGGGAGISR